MKGLSIKKEIKNTYIQSINSLNCINVTETVNYTKLHTIIIKKQFSIATEVIKWKINIKTHI